MSYQVRKGRKPGILEIIYEGDVTQLTRLEAIERGWLLMGEKPVHVAIIDFTKAELHMSREATVDFQIRQSGDRGTGRMLIIYVSGPQRERFEFEALVGFDQGRLIEVVPTMDEAYRLLDESEPDDPGS